MSERSDRTRGATEPPTDRGGADRAIETFVVHRNLLFTVAYAMLPGCGRRRTG
ncbi:hypothetical protein ACWD48_37315 [Streptomyces sp. NPDC002519]